MSELLAATALFVLAHFALSSSALRGPLVATLGEGPFRGVYSIVAAASLVWAAFAFGAAPVVVLWPEGGALAWIPLLVMPFAFLLAIAAYSTPSPTRIGAKAKPGEVPSVVGMLRVTRHPLMWAIVLWAVSHILAKGDLASLVFMGGMIVLALGGALHIDSRRAREFGAAWGPILLSTSVVPFAAILSGRTRMDWAGIGWWRPAVALAVYAVLLLGHEWIFGVSALPT